MPFSVCYPVSEKWMCIWNFVLSIIGVHSRCWGPLLSPALQSEGSHVGYALLPKCTYLIFCPLEGSPNPVAVDVVSTPSTPFGAHLRGYPSSRDFSSLAWGLSGNHIKVQPRPVSSLASLTPVQLLPKAPPSKPPACQYPCPSWLPRNRIWD